MRTYTVQCGYAAYYANTVTVEAETLDAALEKAIAAANDDPSWKAIDHCGDTFVDAVAEGANTDPWHDFASALPIPARFTEAGAPPVVTIVVKGGGVQDVSVSAGRVRVCVKDYDTEGVSADDHDLCHDEDGADYALADWGVLS